MPTPELNDLQLRLYLLGMLPEDAALAIEEQLFRDLDIFESVVGARKQLLRDFASKRLTIEESAELTRQLERSPELAAEFALAKNAVAAERTRRLWWIAAAAMIAFAVILFSSSREKRNTYLASSSLQQGKLTPKKEAVTTAFFLSAGLTRSQGIPQQIRLTGDTERIALQAEVRSGLTSRWNAKLFSGKDQVLEQHGLPVTTNNYFSYVTIDVPKEKLATRHFFILLTPVDHPMVRQRIDFEVLSQRGPS